MHGQFIAGIYLSFAVGTAIHQASIVIEVLRSFDVFISDEPEMYRSAFQR